MQIGPYRVLRVLARGGMGEVCLASLERAGGFRKLVALKRALPEFAADPAFIDMFQREARLAAALNHRNIVQVFDFAHHADEAWLAMEYVRGVDLKAVLDAERLPVGLAVTIGLACARALDYVHRATDAQGQPLHLVHQDVSPANVLLSYEGDIKVSDFGVAWQGNAAQRGMEGKLGYMSPEAVQGQRLDARADQFALGTVLYEMLSGVRAFWADDGAEAIINRVRTATPLSPLSDVAPTLTSALRGVVERAMAADPADRFDDVGALAQALDQAAVDVDRSARLGPWLSTRFPEVDAIGDAPAEVTAAASAPIAALPIAPAPKTPIEVTMAASAPIAAERSVPAPGLGDSPRKAGLIWGLIAVLVGAAAFIFWPAATITPIADGVVDAAVVDARLVDARVAVDARVDAHIADARPVDARVEDAAPIRDTQPPSVPPRRPNTRAPRSRAPRSRAPRSQAPKTAAPRTAAPVAIAPVSAPATTTPASVATLAPLTGPRIRARGARITAGQLLRDGWHRVFAGGAFVRFKGSGKGPVISLRLKPQSGRFLATITSKPFAPLRVDSRPLGSTPAAVVPLPIGRHVIDVGVAPDVTRLTIEIGG